MAKTSINIQPCKVASAERHNGRHKELSYLVPNPDHPNETWVSDRLKQHGTLVKYHAALAAMVKEKTGRTMQTKATPIREAVVVISEDTTMEDLRRLAARMEDTWGIKCLRIDSHFDEGYPRKVQQEGKRNLHAHMIFDYQDWDTGKSIKLANVPAVDEQGKPILDEKGKQVMVKPTTLMQDMAAECLEMDRGEGSDRKHLSALAYKIQQEEKQLHKVSEKLESESSKVEKARSEVEQLSTTKVAKEEAIKTIKTVGARAIDIITGKTKRKEDALKGEILRLRSEIAKKDAEVIQAKKEAQNAKERGYMQALADIRKGVHITWPQWEAITLRSIVDKINDLVESQKTWYWSAKSSEKEIERLQREINKGEEEKRGRRM